MTNPDRLNPTKERLSKPGAEPAQKEIYYGELKSAERCYAIEVTTDTLHGLIRRERLTEPQREAAAHLVRVRMRMNPKSLSVTLQERSGGNSNPTMTDNCAMAWREWGQICAALAGTPIRVIHWLLIDGADLKTIGEYYRPGLKDRATKETVGYEVICKALNAAADYFGY